MGEQKDTRFYFIEQGPLEQMVSKKFGSTQGVKPLRELMWVLLFAYVPVLILSAIEGTFSSHVDIPFMMDYTMQFRSLLALPLLILTKPAINRTTVKVCEYIYDTLLDDKEREEKFLPAIKKLRNLNASWLNEIIVGVLVIVITVLVFHFNKNSVALQDVSGWYGTVQDGEIYVSKAYLWNTLVSMSIARYIFLRWLWLYACWTWLLIKVAGFKLKLNIHHKDKACGLNLLVFPQMSFNMFFVSLAFISSGVFINKITYLHESFEGVKMPIGILIAGSFIMLLGPYLFFMPKLFAAKRLASFSMSRKAHQLGEAYDTAWINSNAVGASDEKPDPSLMTDFDATYEITEKIRPVPFNVADLILLAVPIALAYVPTLLTSMSIKELFKIVMDIVV